MREVPGSTAEFSAGLCTMLVFPTELSCVTHRKATACVRSVAHSHPGICSCLQERRATLMFPNCRETQNAQPGVVLPAVLHTWLIDAGLSLHSEIWLVWSMGAMETCHGIQLFLVHGCHDLRKMLWTMSASFGEGRKPTSLKQCFSAV